MSAKANSRRWPAMATALSSLLAALVVPKCPLCLAAYIGVGGLWLGKGGIVALKVALVGVALYVGYRAWFSPHRSCCRV